MAIAALAIVLFSLSGCATTACPECKGHVLTFNGDGLPIAPTNDLKNSDPACIDDSVHTSAGWSVLTQKCYQIEVDAILSGIEGLDAQGKDVLVFFHGGMNTLRASRERARNLLDDHAPGNISAKNYPIFINWQSSLVSSYMDHLFKVRQGRRRPIISKLTFPFTLGRDLAIGALDIVPGTVQLALNGDDQREPRGTDSAVQQDDIDVRAGKDRRGRGEEVISLTKGVVFFPFVPFTTGLVIDSLGKESWSVMLRRTQLMFHAERCTSTLGRDDAKRSRFDCTTSQDGLDLPDPQECRSLLVALRGIQSATSDSFDPSTQSSIWNPMCQTEESESLRLKTHGPKNLVLVAHSAGALILNQALREVPELKADSIVYMAGAAPMADFEDTVLGDGVKSGYLSEKCHSSTQVYLLSLHDLAELRESYLGFFDIAPRGSLLVWIDDFLSEPKFERERTMGRASTLAKQLDDVPETLRSRLHVKIFDFGKTTNECHGDWSYRAVHCQPQSHGEFSDAPFWDKTFWNPETLRSEEAAKKIASTQ